MGKKRFRGDYISERGERLGRRGRNKAHLIFIESRGWKTKKETWSRGGEIGGG